MWYMYVIHGLSLKNFSSETARLVLPCQHYFTPELSLFQGDPGTQPPGRSFRAAASHAAA
ncbi:hypothetical protein GGP83_003254 [Salinibacter ruber]|uniref:Uncharacterized protein n=1 Tax=Salinibacter ruber TaxID=146919 RepID=A0A9X2UBI5_9BACT|nr:hypothetical protein [Salinibacter ruber]